MIKAVLSSQNTMMDRFSDFAEAQEAIYELRSATEALLEAHTDVRELKADRAHTVLQTQALSDIHKQLRDETNKTRKAEKEIATLKAKLEESTKRAKEKEMEDMWRNVIKSDMAAATASLAKVSQSEERAREELDSIRLLMAKQAAEQTATIDQLRAEVSQP
jgi:DNA polymerase III delta prime subunit